MERVALFVLRIVSTSTACRLPHTHTRVDGGGAREGGERTLRQLIGHNMPTY